MAWAARPATSSRVRSSRNARTASPAGHTPRSPNRASSTGCRGAAMAAGRRTSPASSRQCPTNGPTAARHARPSRPSEAAVVIDGPGQRGCRPVHQRVGEHHVRVEPGETVVPERQPGPSRRAHAERMGRRAQVVAEPGQRQLAGPGAAAHRLGGLDHPHPQPRPSQRHRRGQPVGPRSHDDGIQLVRRPVAWVLGVPAPHDVWPGSARRRPTSTRTLPRQPDRTSGGNWSLCCGRDRRCVTRRPSWGTADRAGAPGRAGASSRPSRRGRPTRSAGEGTRSSLTPHLR
jgi:hypothetical protein